MTLDRRTFVRTSVGAAAVGTIPVGLAPTDDPDAWMAELVAPHRHFYDCTAHRNGEVFSQARNCLDTSREAYGLADTDTQLLIGFHGSAYPLAFVDEAWIRFALGKRANVLDASGQPLTRHPTLDDDRVAPGARGATLRALQARGLRVLLCNNTLKRVTNAMAADLQRPADEVRKELLALLVPGVRVVPAMTIAINRLQARGVTYQAMGG